jgi:UDP-3-O-[3-hydroxymyristoyl] glucosamine N-acyltransferase
LPSAFLTEFILPVMNLDEVARRIRADLRGDGSAAVSGVAPLHAASGNDITFVSDGVPHDEALASPAQALIVSARMAAVLSESGRSLLVASNPKLAFARAITLFHSSPYTARGVSGDLALGEGARLGPDCSIHPRVTIGVNSIIGDRVTLHPGVSVGDHVVIGDDTVIFANVSVYNETLIGARCRIHSGSIIGSDGFSFVPDEEGHQYKLLQVGRVVIEDDVEIGANCCIDRASFGETRIRRGVKFDNLIQVGHNCDIGEDTVVAALTGFSGGTVVGRNCIIAGQVGTNQHITIGDGAIITARTGVTKSVAAGKFMGGMMAAMDYQKWRRVHTLYARLPELFERLKKLEKEASRPD